MEDNINKPSKNFFLTFVQIVSALAVVTLHTNGCFWAFSSTERYWFSANIIESVCYFAVPVFFMITGITLIDYRDRYDTKTFFIKRFSKTLVPYVARSLIGVAFLLVTHRIPQDTVTFKWVLNGLLSTEGIIDLYWFFQPLFCVYLCIPLFAHIEKSEKKMIIQYLLVASLCINFFFPFLNSVLKLQVQWPYRVSVVSGYLFWVLSGWYVHNYPPTKTQKVVICIFSLVGLLMITVGTYLLSVKYGSIQSLYKGYFNFPCILYTFGVFVCLRDLSIWIEKINFLKKIICFVGNYAFPLYLIHWFVLRIREDIFVINTKSIFWRIFAPYAILLVVIAFTWCLRKIPYVRRIVP